MFRFIARDLGEAPLVEAGVDDFRIRTLRGVQSVDSPVASAPLRLACDGRDAAGALVPSGVYFYRVSAGEFSQVRKMVLLK